MKPIASRKSGWIVQPVQINRTIDGAELWTPDGVHLAFMLPDGLTFSQFLDQYAACTDPIYFID